MTRVKHYCRSRDQTSFGQWRIFQQILHSDGIGGHIVFQNGTTLIWNHREKQANDLGCQVNAMHSDRIAKHMKVDRDANFMAQNKDGVTVNRWTTTGYLASSAAPNEAGYLTVKTIRALGMTSIDTQARI